LSQLSPIVSKLLSSFRKRNQRRLRKLNDEILHSTALEFDKAHFNLAVFSYVLSKIVSKPRYLGKECAGCLERIESTLEDLSAKIDSASEADVLESFTELEHAIARLDERDPRFVISLITKGKLKTAATFYAQGISLGVASEMTGLDKQEILDYAGETMMFDRLKDEKSIADRMKVARKLLSA
jgi:hypothetical protein